MGTPLYRLTKTSRWGSKSAVCTAVDRPPTVGFSTVEPPVYTY